VDAEVGEPSAALMAFKTAAVALGKYSKPKTAPQVPLFQRLWDSIKERTEVLPFESGPARAAHSEAWMAEGCAWQVGDPPGPSLGPLLHPFHVPELGLDHHPGVCAAIVATILARVDGRPSTVLVDWTTLGFHSF